MPCGKYKISVKPTLTHSSELSCQREFFFLLECTDNSSDLTWSLGREDKMLSFDLRDLVLSVAHVSMCGVEDQVTVRELTHHRECYSLSVNESTFAALIASEVLLHKAALGQH